VLARSLALALTAVALLWVVILLAAPILLARTGPSPPLAAVYSAAHLICHQRPERSFTIGGTQVPVCARCSGLYVAGASGALVALLVTAGRVQPGSRRVRLALALAAAPTAITVAAEWLGLASPSNVLRALAALPLGAVAGWVFVRMLVQAPDATRDMIV
jgi:uncharacterized membrane protein